jgi:hypothetical protein
MVFLWCITSSEHETSKGELEGGGLNYATNVARQTLGASFGIGTTRMPLRIGMTTYYNGPPSRLNVDCDEESLSARQIVLFCADLSLIQKA